MKYKNVISSILTVAFILTLSFNAYSFIKHNGIGTAYDEGEAPPGLPPDSIETYNILGGGYYLEAASIIQKLLYFVELQDTRGIDYTALKKVVANADNNMKKATKIFKKLVKKAEVTPYNEIVIQRLRDFDYETFKQEKGLNGTVFEMVAEKLRNGDVTAILKHTYADFTKIVGMLEEIKKNLAKNRLPGTLFFLELNETLAISSLFGSFTARIFAEIK